MQPFGLRHDLIGLAFSWGEPDGGQNKDDQFGLEAFWRLRIIDRVELSPILQYVIKPANSGTDTRLGGGLRLRIVL
jgi:carbohydrate-selective porin OprB